MARFLSLSLALHISLKSLFNHGQNLSETRLLRVGACFSRISEKMFVHLLTTTLTSSVFRTMPLQSTPKRSLGRNKAEKTCILAISERGH